MDPAASGRFGSNLDPEPHALEDLFRDRWAPLVRLAWLMCGSRETAEDVVQEAFLRLRSDSGDLPEHPFAYLRQIVINQIRDRRRHQAVVRRHQQPPVEPVLDGDDRLVWQLFQGLPERQRFVLVLRYYDDLPVAEIAQMLDCPEGTVKSLISRGLRTLRRELDV
jgi:RNA polymerase sigma factor (sigma-70 family)